MCWGMVGPQPWHKRLLLSVPCWLDRLVDGLRDGFDTSQLTVSRPESLTLAHAAPACPSCSSQGAEAEPIPSIVLRLLVDGEWDEESFDTRLSMVSPDHAPRRAALCSS